MATDTGAKPETAAAPGFLGILGNLYIAPSEAFAAVLKRPVWWLPLLLAMAMNGAFSAAWLKRVDPEPFMKARFAENPRTRDMPAEQRNQMIEQQAKALPFFASIGPVFVGLAALVMAGVLVFVFRFFFAGEVTFKQGLAITAWVFAATSLVTVPLL